MAFLDTTLVRPTRHSLVEALVEATAAANDGRELLTLDRAHWEGVVPTLRDEPQGVLQWGERGLTISALVRLAWWTDSLGRRHFRVLGANSTDPGFRYLPSLKDNLRNEDRPPLWHVYPERVFRRHTRSHSGWVAACACGMCGPPGQIGWTGTCCGACHGRSVAEGRHEPPAELPPATIREHDHGVWHLALSPDGRTLASVDRSGALLLWDVTRGRRLEPVPPPGDPVHALAFSPDGRLLATAEGRIHYFGFNRPTEAATTCGIADTLRVVDLRTDSPVLLHAERFLVDCLAFSPDGLALAAGGPSGLLVWRRNDRAAPWHLAHADDQLVTALAFSPRGDWLATGRAHQAVVLRTADWQPVPPFASPFLNRQFVIAFGFPDEGTLAGAVALGTGGWVRGHVVSASWVGELRLWNMHPTGTHPLESYPLGKMGYAAFSPDGRWLAWLRDYSPNVTFVEVATGREVGALAWDLAEPLSCAAFSPDGQTLATGGRRGTIKLWPWRRLLDA